MKVKYIKFYIGARVGGKVVTSLSDSENGAPEMALVDTGVIVRSIKHTTDKQGRDISVPESILVPFNNIAYAEIVEETAPKAKAVKGT